MPLGPGLRPQPLPPQPQPDPLCFFIPAHSRVLSISQRPHPVQKQHMLPNTCDSRAILFPCLFFYSTCHLHSCLWLFTDSIVTLRNKNGNYLSVLFTATDLPLRDAPSNEQVLHTFLLNVCVDRGWQEWMLEDVPVASWGHAFPSTALALPIILCLEGQAHQWTPYGTRAEWWVLGGCGERSLHEQAVNKFCMVSKMQKHMDSCFCPLA